MGKPPRTALIDKLQKRHPGTRRQRNDHGAGRKSVEFFDRATGALVATYDTSDDVVAVYLKRRRFTKP